MARFSPYEAPAILADPFGLDRLIEWKLGSITNLKRTRTETIARGAHMQRQFTIELRVDFADSEKLGPLKQVLQQAARHAYATAQLISDNPKSTQIAIFSDDFFTGHEEIKLLDDVIQQGLDQTGEDSSGGSEGVSSELLAAVQAPKDAG
jgi:hypothetical protein